MIAKLEGRTALDTVAADYWSPSEDCECLSLTSPEEALEVLCDGLPDGDIEAEIRKEAPMTIHAWQRQRVEEKHIQWAIDSCLEIALERFSEDYGGPDGEELPSAEGRRKLRALFEPPVRAVFALDVWRCERFVEVTLSADDAVALLREHCPEWFEESSQ